MFTTLHRTAGSMLVMLTCLLLGAAPAAAQCAGDCNGDGEVKVNELITAVNIALNLAPVANCGAADTNGDGTVVVSELIQGVNRALNGCGSVTPSPSTPTPTPTQTSPGGTPTNTAPPPPNCGNGSIEAGQGETCDDGNHLEGPGDVCPADCRVLPCAASTQAVAAEVVFETTPADLLVTGMTLFVRYPDGSVDVPGVNDDPPVQAAVTSDLFSITPNDVNFALTAVLIDPFFLGVNAGTAMNLELTVCGGAGVPPASAFDCRVTDATDENLQTVTDQVTCRVVLP